MKKRLITCLLIIASLVLTGCQKSEKKVEICSWYREYFNYIEVITHDNDKILNIVKISTESSNVLADETNRKVNTGMQKYLNEVDGIKVTTQVDNNYNFVQTIKYDFNKINLNDYVKAVKNMNNDEKFGISEEDPTNYIIEDYVSLKKYKDVNLKEYTCFIIND